MKSNYKTVLRNLTGLLVFTFISGSLFAQTNFSGKWVFSESKSNMGEGRFRRAATTMVVTQDAKVLTVESTMPGRDGSETKTTAKYNLDGTVSENPMFNSTRKSTVTWSDDKKSITISSTMTFERDGERREIKSTETWKLSGDGNALTIDSVRPGREGGEIKQTLAYDKK